MKTKKYVDLFVKETKEHLAALRNGLLALKDEGFAAARIHDRREPARQCHRAVVDRDHRPRITLPRAFSSRRALPALHSRPPGGGAVPGATTSLSTDSLTRLLTIVVLVIMLVAVLYALWIGVANYSRIGV